MDAHVGLAIITLMFFILIWYWGWQGMYGSWREKFGPFLVVVVSTTLILGILWIEVLTK